MSNMSVVPFGCRHFVEHEGLAFNQMRRAAQYYNVLVAIERWRRREFSAIRSAHVAGLSEMEDAYAQLTEWLNEQRKSIRAKRQKASVKSVDPRKIVPTKRVDADEEKDEIAELQTWRRELGARLKAPRAEFAALIEPGKTEYKRRTGEAKKGDNHAKKRLNATVREAMLEEPEWHQAWKELALLEASAYDLRNWVFEASGLAHGTYHAVREDVKRAGKRPPPRPDGEPRKPKKRPQFSRLRFRKIGWQLHDLTWADILAGKSSHIQIVERRSARTPSPSGRGGRRNPQNHSAAELAKREREGAGKGNRSRQEYATAKIRVGTTEDRLPIWATIEAFLARPIPMDAQVRWVYLVPREVGDRWSYSLQFTLDTEKPLIERLRGDGIASIDLCWTKRDETLLVARVNGTEDIVLPSPVVSGLRYAEQLRSDSDKHFDTARDALLDRIKSRLTPDWVREAAATAPHWRAHWKLERIAHRWSTDLAATGQLSKLWSSWKAHRSEQCKDFHSDLETVSGWLTTQGVTDEPTQFVIWLEWWRRKDVHMTQMQTNIRRRAMNRRKDFYRCTAATLVKSFARCELGELDLAAVAIRDLPEAKAKELHQAARHQRVLAAPYELKQAIKYAFGPDSYSERSGDDESPVTARGDEKDNEADEMAATDSVAAE
jgi:hypothetical protein